MILRWLLLGPIAILASVLLLNACDRSLKAEVEAYARPVQPEVPAEQNAFYAMLGFLAPAGENPHTFGQQAAARFEDAIRRTPALEAFDLYEGVKPAELREWGAPVCRQGEASCLDAVAERSDDVWKALLANEVLLKRYVSLYAYRGYANTLTPHLSSPIASGSVVGVHSLWLAGQALQAIDGNTGEVLGALQNDLRFWRGLAAQRGNLIEKMVAVACITRDVRLVSDLLRVADLNPAQQRQVEGMLVPLSAGEKNLAEAFREEFRSHHLLFQNLDVFDDPGFTWVPGMFEFSQHAFFHPNATSNRLYEMYQDYTQLAALPAPDYLAREKGVLERHQRENHFYSWRSVYNPIGRILLGVAAPSQLFYVARVHDLDGLMRLVNLQARIRAADVRAESVADFVAHEDGYLDPYTGKPMSWDARERRLSFKGYGRTRGESIWIRI